MKKLLVLLTLFPSLALAAANSMLLEQRNSTNSGNVTRIVDFPVTDGLFWYNTTTFLPSVVTLGSNLSITGGVLNAASSSQVNSDWTAASGVTQILNKPAFATVSFTGQYADLIGSPALATVATSGAYTDLTGRPSLATVATTGSYTDLINKPTIPTVPAPSQASASRALNTAFQVSASRPSLVIYSVQITVTASIAGGQNGDVILEIASDSGFTTNVQTVAITGSGQTYTLAIALQGVQPQTSVVSGLVPVGYYARLRTVSNTGSPAFSFRAGQETLL